MIINIGSTIILWWSLFINTNSLVLTNTKYLFHKYLTFYFHKSRSPVSTNPNLLNEEIWSRKQIVPTICIQIQSSVNGNPLPNEILTWGWEFQYDWGRSKNKNLDKNKSPRKPHLHGQDGRPGDLFSSCFSLSSSSPFPPSFSSRSYRLLLMMGES